MSVVEEFSLWEVRLLEGPFQQAMERDRAYLRALEPDRLLHNFRVNAGLSSEALPLGGWEAPDCELRGHFVGHYLSACARMTASTDDTLLPQNAHRVVRELAKCQQALGSGYLSAFPETFLDRVETQERVWAPWYTLHKLFAGLQDMVVFLGDTEALEVVCRMAEWALRRTDKLSNTEMERMLGNEHGGMSETLANLSALTGDPRWLTLAQRFNHRAVLEPLTRREDRLTGLHANTQIPKAIGAARQYELTGDPALKTAAEFFWETVLRERSYVIGGNSDCEKFSPKERLSQHLSPETAETCNTYNMLRLTRFLFRWQPKSEYADDMERALLNHILASQHPETGMMCYYVPLRSGASKVYNTPNDDFWCCTGTGVENHAQYGDSIYFRSGKPNAGADTLTVNLFIASELRWKERGLTLRQETHFPEAPSTQLRFACEQPLELTLCIRRPHWVGDGFGIAINGETVAADISPEGYAVVSRLWQTGDTVEVALPMTLRTEGFRDNPNRLAFLYGPVVLAAEVEASENPPALVMSEPDAVSSLSPVAGKPLHFSGSPERFRTAGQPEPATLTLLPFYAMHDRPYAVYWDRYSPEQWQAQEESFRAEQERQRDILARTVDSVVPFDAQSEQAHGFQGERTYAGDFGLRTYRDARDTGWFSYDLTILPDTPMELLCTYWGSEFGREFDILIDNERLATQALDHNAPDRFFQALYPLPTRLTEGKTRLTVRFSAPSRGLAGSVFECRTLRQSRQE